jgi:hypothetical protein
VPALFAYLVAVVLLLSSGYGALNWLAAPEPLKVVAKVKPKAVPRYEVIPPIADSSDTSSTASIATGPPATDENKATVAEDATSKDTVSVASKSEPPASGDRLAEVSGPIQDSKIRAIKAEVPAAVSGRGVPVAESKGEVSESVQPPSPPRPNIRQTSDRPRVVASADSAAGTKTTNRPRLNQVSKRAERSAPSERRSLVMMTLRTIEFADDRRATRLIPYRNAERDFDD